jgi:hypothetical protein
MYTKAINLLVTQAPAGEPFYLLLVHGYRVWTICKPATPLQKKKKKKRKKKNQQLVSSGIIPISAASKPPGEKIKSMPPAPLDIASPVSRRLVVT